MGTDCISCYDQLSKSIYFPFRTADSALSRAITCTVQYSGAATGSVALTYQGSNTWTASNTSVNGVHTVTLKATDDTSSVVISIGGLYLNTTSLSLPSWTEFINLYTVVGILYLCLTVLVVKNE